MFISRQLALIVVFLAKKKIVSVYKHSEARDIDILLKSFKPDSPTLAEFLQNRRKQVSQMLAVSFVHDISFSMISVAIILGLGKLPYNSCS